MFENMGLKEMEKMRNILQRKSPKSPDLRDILNSWEEMGRHQLTGYYEWLIRDKKAVTPYGEHRGRRKKDIVEELAQTEEKAYQRAFYFASRNKQPHTTLIHKEPTRKTVILWVDMEIPVACEGEQRRKRPFDLIGRTQSDGHYVIAELKDTDGDSPFYAIFEALEYALLIKDLRANGHGLPCYHGDEDYWKSYKDCKYLIVGAPEEYWEKWKDHLVKLREVNRRIKEYTVILAKFVCEDFKSQKRDRPKYRPELLNNKHNIWEEI